MLVVPIIGDKVEVLGGVVSTVLSFSNYGKDGPAIYIESPDKPAQTESIPYTSIEAINGTPVKLTSGKIFSASSLIKRGIQLPQPGDKVTNGNQTISVKSLKMAVRGDLSKGLIVVGEDFDSKQKTELSIREITGIERTDGGTDFSRKSFSTQYKDYLGSSSKA